MSEIDRALHTCREISDRELSTDGDTGMDDLHALAAAFRTLDVMIMRGERMPLAWLDCDVEFRRVARTAAASAEPATCPDCAGTGRLALLFADGPTPVVPCPICTAREAASVEPVAVKVAGAWRMAGPKSWLRMEGETVVAYVHVPRTGGDWEWGAPSFAGYIHSLEAGQSAADATLRAAGWVLRGGGK